MTILRKHRAGDLMPLDPHRRVRFQEDVYVLKNPWPVTNKVFISVTYHLEGSSSLLRMKGDSSAAM